MPTRIARKRIKLSETALMVLVNGRDYFNEFHADEQQKQLREFWKLHGRRISKAVAPIIPAAAQEYDGDVARRGHFTMDDARKLLALLET